MKARKERRGWKTKWSGGKRGEGEGRNEGR